MVMLSLNRLMLKKERRRCRRIQARNGSFILAPQKRDPLCQGGNSDIGERSTYSWQNLPEDIWCHIHSLMPLCDSARSACVSRTFLCSWRCHPKLIFTEETLGLTQNACRKSDLTKSFTSRVDDILKNHIGVGVKTLKIAILNHYNISTSHLNTWLHHTIKSGIEEVTLLLPIKYRAEYNLPCSILLDGRGNTIQYLYLTYCALRPTVGFDSLRSLRKLHLFGVRITGDELVCLISHSFGLEQLELTCCHELIILKMPFCLDRLSWLRVSDCKKLQVIEITAPNVSSFDFCGDPVQLLLGESLQVKSVNVDFPYEPNCISYAITKLASIVPHLETLTISSVCERVNTPIVTSKFLHLKYLNIYLGEDDDRAVSPAYDYLSLASFLDASPVLETFILSVDQDDMQHESVFGDASSHLRQIHECKLDRLKKVQINGFCSAKSMVELACHILENASALESLTLDSIFSQEKDADIVRCSGKKSGKCMPKSRQMILEAHRALEVIKRYILERVPTTVKLNVREPCSRCHVLDVKLV